MEQGSDDRSDTKMRCLTVKSVIIIIRELAYDFGRQGPALENQNRRIANRLERSFNQLIIRPCYYWTTKWRENQDLTLDCSITNVLLLVRKGQGYSVHHLEIRGGLNVSIRSVKVEGPLSASEAVHHIIVGNSSEGALSCRATSFSRSQHPDVERI